MQEPELARLNAALSGAEVRCAERDAASNEHQLQLQTLQQLYVYAFWSFVCLVSFAVSTFVLA